jgi:hypothetical protein
LVRDNVTCMWRRRSPHVTIAHQPHGLQWQFILGANLRFTFQRSASTTFVSLVAIPVDSRSLLLCLQVFTLILYDSLLFLHLIKHFNAALQPPLYRLSRSQLIAAHYYFACRCPPVYLTW